MVTTNIRCSIIFYPSSPPLISKIICAIFLPRRQRFLRQVHRRFSVKARLPKRKLVSPLGKVIFAANRQSEVRRYVNARSQLKSIFTWKFERFPLFSLRTRRQRGGITAARERVDPISITDVPLTLSIRRWSVLKASPPVCATRFNYKSDGGAPMRRKSRGRLVISRRNGVENRSVSPGSWLPARIQNTS